MGMVKRAVGSVGVLFGLLAVPGVTLAQTVTHPVSGRVVDVNGDPIPDARVVLSYAGGSNVESPGPQIAAVTTDASGRFMLRVPVSQATLKINVLRGGETFTWEPLPSELEAKPGFLLFYPSACSSFLPSAPGRCHDLVKQAGDCFFPGQGPLPKLCDPNWPSPLNQPTPPAVGSPNPASLVALLHPANWVDPFHPILQAGSAVPRDASSTAVALGEAGSQPGIGQVR